MGSTLPVQQTCMMEICHCPATSGGEKLSENAEMKTKQDLFVLTERKNDRVFLAITSLKSFLFRLFWFLTLSVILKLFQTDHWIVRKEKTNY